MLVPQSVDQLVVVVALVGTQAGAPFQQLGVALLHLIKQELRLRLLGARRCGDLERQRQLVGSVHHQVHQVAEPGVSVVARALDAPIGIPVAAPVAVFLGCRPALGCIHHSLIVTLASPSNSDTVQALPSKAIVDALPSASI